MHINHRSRGRSTFFVAILSLIALNAALAWKVNSAPGLRDPVFDLPSKEFGERMHAAPGKPLTIAFLGSSRTGNGVRPVIVQRDIDAASLGPCVAENLYAEGNGPLGQHLHWRRLVDRGERPDVVVLELILPGFTDGGPKENAGAFGADRMTWDELQVAREYGYRDSGVPDWYEANLNPWFGYRFQMMGLWRPKWIPLHVQLHVHHDPGEFGWKRPFHKQRDEAIYAEAIKVTHDGLFNRIQLADFRGNAARAFRDMVDSCIEKGTVPAVYMTPESSLVRSWCPPNVEAELQKYLAELRAAGAVVGDGREWLPDQAFSDGHHTVQDWADEYSRRLTQELVIPAARRARETPCPASSTAVP